MRIIFTWSDNAGELRISPAAEKRILEMAAEGVCSAESMIAADLAHGLENYSTRLREKVMELRMAAPMPGETAQ